MIANVLQARAAVGATIIVDPNLSVYRWYSPGEKFTVSGYRDTDYGPAYLVHERTDGCVVFEKDALVLIDSFFPAKEEEEEIEAEEEYSGGSVDYYKVLIENPTSGGEPYTAEANDLIEALGMNYAEGNAFKALWRSCAARTLGKRKKGQDAEGLYDAHKLVFFGKRIVVQRGGEL